MDSKIKKVIEILTASVNVTGVSFVNIKGYVSKKSDNTELQDVLINVNVPYETAKKKDVEMLKNLDIAAFKAETGTDLSIDLLETAKKELIGSLIAPAKARSEGQKDAYTHINGFIKVHNETGHVYIFGMKVRKTVRVEGDFGKDTRRPLTVAKDLLRSRMKSAKYRQYIITDIFDRLDSIKISGENIEF